MIAKGFDGYVLTSEWEAEAGRYRLVLINHTGRALSGFRLGFSGPARVSDGARIEGGQRVSQLSNYCEIVPEAGFVLAAGASWTIDISGLDYPIRHWTDGATASFVIGEDGLAVAAVTVPTRLAGSAA